MNAAFQLGRAAALLVAALAALTASGLEAQTPEGTIITNEATVTFTDANSNSYTPVVGSVDVTVGFGAGITFVAAAASVSPASPSTADTLLFTYTNMGNGDDSLRVTETITVGSVITVTGYRVGATTHVTLAALNSALAATLVASGGTLEVRVVYDVASGVGGVPTDYEFTGFSRRDAGQTQLATTTILPDQVAGVFINPDAAQNLQHLPSNGTDYTFTFKVGNSGTGPDDIDLVASHPGTAITIVSVNGVGGTTTTVSVPATDSIDVDVIYTVLSVAAGTPDTLVLAGTSVFDAGQSDTGSADMTVVEPDLTITKVAYRDDKTTLIGAGLVAPGEFIQYLVTVTNGGFAAATGVEITDPLPAELTYSSTTEDVPADWSTVVVGNNVTATLTVSLAGSGSSRFIWIRAQVN